MPKRKRITAAQVARARKRLGRAWRKLERLQAIEARARLKVVIAADEKAKALDNLANLESMYNSG